MLWTNIILGKKKKETCVTEVQVQVNKLLMIRKPRKAKLFTFS